MTLKDRVTSNDVAQRAGVSQSAVSRVFTPGASASLQTADKVRKAAAELGYRPNSLARAMVSGKTGIIGLVVAYFSNQFYPEALEKLSSKLQSQGYHVLVFMASQAEGDINNVVEEIIDYQVDGIITASVSLSSELSQQCSIKGLPLVMFNRIQDDPSLSAVTSNNYEGGRKVADLLIESGHQKIAYIAGWEGASTQRDREAGFVARLKEDGMKLYARGVGDFDPHIARQATLNMCSGADYPDAIFVANDHMALTVMDTLRYELGRKIPDDISIVGYDDVPAAAWPSYQLTTVHQPADEMVDRSIEVLLSQINGNKQTPKKIVIDGPLILRGSAKIPKGWKDEGI